MCAVRVQLCSVITSVLTVCIHDLLLSLVGLAHCVFSLFFFNDTATTEIYTLSLHDALPICLEIFNFELSPFWGHKFWDFVTPGWSSAPLQC